MNDTGGNIAEEPPILKSMRPVAKPGLGQSIANLKEINRELDELDNLDIIKRPLPKRIEKKN